MKVHEGRRRPIESRPFPPGARPHALSQGEGQGTPAFIERGLARALEDEAARAARASKETLALLLGDRFKDPASGLPFAVATDRATAPLLTTPTHVRFDTARFGDLAAALDAVASPYLIVGWFHSHLGQGCQPSATDLATHRRYFVAPHQFALVLDPVSRSAGAFALEGERMVRRPLHVFDGAPTVPDSG
jgi:proteasome lid subunit RPN8/RPN11